MKETEGDNVVTLEAKKRVLEEVRSVPDAAERSKKMRHAARSQ